MIEHTPRHTAPEKTSSNRTFGLVFTAFFVVVSLLPTLHGYGVRVWALGVAAICLSVAVAIPGALTPLNRLWTKFGLMLHQIVGPVALGILFFLVVTPTALTLRLFGKDLLRLHFDRRASSYWIKRAPPGPDAESLKNQF